MTNDNFDECMCRIRNGDKGGLRDIYEEYNPYIFRLVSSYVKNRADAEDITAEFFINLWKKAGSYKPGNGHKTWMTVMARNIAIDFLRKNNREIPAEEIYEEADQVKESPSAEDEVVSTQSFHDMLASLPAVQQRIVAMKIAGEMTFKEIAGLLDMPMGTVTWHYQQSMKKLKEAIA